MSIFEEYGAFNFVQFDWLKTSSEQHLYLDKSTEQESWNYFVLCRFLR